MDLGSRLRALRTDSGRTIAAVAAVAGLSVPYIANLENDRGNPTLAALERLATALGVRLVIDLVAPPATPTGDIAAFTESDRFRAHAARIAKRTGVSAQTANERLTAVLDAAQLAVGTELSMLDCHRILDGMIMTEMD